MNHRVGLIVWAALVPLVVLGQNPPPLTIRVLQSESVPYTQQYGSGISTNCSITGTANTTGMANTFGNTTYGNATTNSNLRMNCASYNNT